MAKAVSKEQTPMVSMMMVKMGAAMHYFAGVIPAQHKTLKQFFLEQSPKCSCLPMDEVYHWALDVELIVNGLVATKLVSNRSRVNMTPADKENIRVLNAHKRSIKFELTKIKRLSINHCGLVK